ncbi:histidinol-phosphate transaminase [Winogradskyella maritima]|uniref:Histidinol-phosphate aminotransferase n=1 Tax=Winogradskyella maritima TaxID=1517766 RepID=A0ABV8AJ44_9FLAO|nr:histidinol-phosphate transaminase [Winogradskyella maritima]
MESFNLNNLVRDNIKSLKPYSSARDEFSGVPADMVFLDANENPFENGVNRYPDPQQRSVKSLLGEIKGIKSENILLGNGSDEVLDLIFRVFCEPKIDNVITLPPTYGMYEVLANTNDIEVKKVYLKLDFQIDVDQILVQQNDRSKLLFLCSPNNPSGNHLNNKDIERLLNYFNGLVVLDEAYIDFSEQESWLTRLEEFPNLIVTQTLSKAYGMAGIRLGVCYASSDIISILNQIKPPYNVNELTQKKAIERLINKEAVQTEIDTILRERGTLTHALTEIPFISKVYHSDANFVLAKVDDASKRYNQLIEKGIVVRNRTTQPLCENCLRFTVGAQDENKKLIDALKQL